MSLSKIYRAALAIESPDSNRARKMRLTICFAVLLVLGLMMLVGGPIGIAFWPEEHAEFIINVTKDLQSDQERHDRVVAAMRAADPIRYALLFLVAGTIVGASFIGLRNLSRLTVLE